jgi:hypothetical protein
MSESKCGSRSDVAVVHSSGFAISWTERTEGKKKTMLRRSDCYSYTELSMLTVLMSAASMQSALTAWCMLPSASRVSGPSCRHMRDNEKIPFSKTTLLLQMRLAGMNGPWQATYHSGRRATRKWCGTRASRYGVPGAPPEI